MADEIKVLDPTLYKGFGGSGVERTNRSRKVQKYNRWKREVLSVCWDCRYIGECSRQCQKVKDYLKAEGREDLLTNESVNDYVRVHK